jgi:trehalose 6-phosphate synthase
MDSIEDLARYHPDLALPERGPHGRSAAPTHAGRVVVVSNRVGTATSLRSSPGGLASAMLAALAGRRAMWFGWSGETVEGAPAAPRVVTEGDITRVLVDLPRADYERYYNGFSNRALWPLFHYRIGMAEYLPEDHAGYLRVNEEFAARLVPFLEAGDVIWVHDYHLIPLGGFLRARGVRNRIGFFLHTPFPGSEILTTMPVHASLMRALADYDLLGFQTASDATAFSDYIIREAHGTVARDGTVSAFDRNFRIGVFPVGIDAQATESRARHALASLRGRRLRDSLTGRKLIIGVDRLDYSKGLIQRFKAVELMYAEHPEHRRGTVVLQIAPISREEVPEYRQVRSELNALIGHINGRFGEPDLLPVRYLNKNFGQQILFGFFRLAAVGLVTSLRDGMNLVAKEYVASQDAENPGVPVLSRFAGASKQLDAALIVNPFDPQEIAAATHRALGMPIEERRERHGAMMRVLRGYDIETWRDAFLAALSPPARRRRKPACPQGGA